MIQMFLLLWFLLCKIVSSDSEVDCNEHLQRAGCITCYYINNCHTCGKHSYMVRGGAYYSCRTCRYECTSCNHYDNCISCVTGRYGRYCQLKCGKGCMNSTCDKETGYCSCMENFEGEKCNRCDDDKFRYDFDCSVNCPENCRTCLSNRECTLCNTGHYGMLCEHSCSMGCLHGNCSKSTGVCYNNECKPNFTGMKCDQCITGLFGDDCSSSCPNGCVSCNSYSSCRKCKNGYWGKICQNNCSAGCLYGICMNDSGICDNNAGCTNGYWGENCTLSCPGTCKDEICHKENGTCSQGCTEDYTGHRCGCPATCSCDEEEKCQKNKDTVVVTEETDVSSNTRTIIGFGIGAVVVFSSMVVIFMLIQRYIRRRTHQHEDKNNKI